ncbi:hypothetical protein [Rhodopseudomonas telluris]|uniref:Restriction system protein Mrr-like N-terminal domain-containing protein n=1 Tax=Rhodopseudomonas telluris TaxID=644215 RepID=A0ABV6EUG0_9BRAD
MAILKVLSTYPDGLAAPAALNADLAVLSGSEDWTSRMRSYAAREPALDIFTQGLVVRDRRGWQITAAGRAMIDRLEGRHPADTEPPRAPEKFARPDESDSCGAMGLPLDAVTAAQPRPQLMLIQGGKMRPRVATASGAAVKGAVSRP